MPCQSWVTSNYRYNKKTKIVSRYANNKYLVCTPSIKNIFTSHPEIDINVKTPNDKSGKGATPAPIPELSVEEVFHIPNNEYIDCLPDRIVVEVPAKINNQGIHGITLENYPKGFGNLLNSQVGVIQLTTEAILSKSKHFAYLALLADPVVDNAINAEKLLNNMIGTQEEFLGYLNWGNKIVCNKNWKN